MRLSLSRGGAGGGGGGERDLQHHVGWMMGSHDGILSCDPACALWVVVFPSLTVRQVCLGLGGEVRCNEKDMGFCGDSFCSTQCKIAQFVERLAQQLSSRTK